MYRRSKSLVLLSIALTCGSRVDLDWREEREVDRDRDDAAAAVLLG